MKTCVEVPIRYCVNVCKCNSSSNVPFLKNYKGLFSTLPNADKFFPPHSTKNSQTFKFRKKTEHWYKVEFLRVSGDFALEHCRTLQNNTEHYTSTHDNPQKETFTNGKQRSRPDRIIYQFAIETQLEKWGYTRGGVLAGVILERVCIVFHPPSNIQTPK